MARRLILFFDGTWNKASCNTNVSRLRAALDTHGTDGMPQVSYYEPGVGTNWYDRITGGAFGRGLSANMRQGYSWLCRQYQFGDEIFLFGFSRGAYTARSLVGMIRKCGLLRQPNSRGVAAAHALYRDKKAHPNGYRAVRFRAEHSHEVRIRFIGVWDTVGSLGVPLTGVSFSRDYYRWHDTELSKIVDYAYHAIALDERRRDFSATLWTKRKASNIDVEQRWFVGSHANVGGGYENDLLPDLPLRWLQEKAVACGLGLKEWATPAADSFCFPLRDSYAEFLWGLYRYFSRPCEREFGTGVHETVDPSVWARWHSDPGYRPACLHDHPERPAEATATAAV